MDTLIHHAINIQSITSWRLISNRDVQDFVVLTSQVSQNKQTGFCLYRNYNFFCCFLFFLSEFMSFWTHVSFWPHVFLTSCLSYLISFWPNVLLTSCLSDLMSALPYFFPTSCPSDLMFFWPRVLLTLYHSTFLSFLSFYLSFNIKSILRKKLQTR